MKPSVFLFFLVFVTIISSQAQNAFQPGSTRIEYRVAKDGRGEVEGSKYIDSEFREAKINRYPDVFFVRYDAEQDVFEFREKSADAPVYILSGDWDVKIDIDQSKKSYKTLFDSKGSLGFFVLEFDTTSYAIVRKEKVVFQPGSKVNDTYSKARPALYKREDDVRYFYNKSSKSLEEIPRKSKAFRSRFAYMQVDAKMLESVDPQDQESLVRFFNAAVKQ
jgi:hypothetical protein